MKILNFLFFFKGLSAVVIQKPSVFQKTRYLLK